MDNKTRCLIGFWGFFAASTPDLEVADAEVANEVAST